MFGLQRRPGRPPRRLISQPISWGVILAVVAGVVLVAGAAVALALALSTNATKTKHDRKHKKPVPVALAFKVCRRTTVITTAQRNALGLKFWPDGSFGAVVTGGHEHFIAADGADMVAQTQGSSSDPLEHGVVAQPRFVTRMPTNYASGGPVYQASSRRWLLFYHAEQWPNGNNMRFYASIGMAVSTDQGHSWQDLGQIIRPHVAYNLAATKPVEVGGGPYVVVGKYFYVYFRDQLTTGGLFGPVTSEFSVARAPVKAVVAASAQGRTVTWHDYDSGKWSQRAIGGTASGLEPNNPPTGWFDVGYDSAVHRYIDVVAAHTGPRKTAAVNLFLSFSLDGLHWTSRRSLTSGPAESFYPSLIGTGSNPQTLGRNFNVLYTLSSGGYSRFNDLVVSRLTIRIGAKHCST